MLCLFLVYAGPGGSQDDPLLTDRRLPQVPQSDQRMFCNWKSCRSRSCDKLLAPMNWSLTDADSRLENWISMEMLYSASVFTPHAPSTTVAHSEGRSSTNESHSICTRGEGIPWRTSVLHPWIIKSRRGICRNKKRWRTEGIWWRRFEKNEIEKEIRKNRNKK